MSSNRRDFLKTVIPAGAFTCLGCKAAFAAGAKPGKKAVHKFKQASGMTNEQVFQFAYMFSTIPTLQALSEAIGKKKFIKMLEEAAYSAAFKMFSGVSAQWPKKDFVTFKNTALAMLKQPVYSNNITATITTNTDTQYSLKVTECLWAKTFKQAQAADIGYAMICHPDYAIPKAVNPKFKMIRTKTLMQGHAYCDHKYVIGA